MTTPITASFQWSKEEFLRSQRLAVRHSRRGRSFYRGTTAVGVVILLSGLVGLFHHTTEWPGFAYIALVSAFFFSMPLFARRAAAKLYAQMPDRDAEVTWDISDGGLSCKTKLAAAEYTWAFFSKVIRVPEGFLIYPNDRQVHWLPLHAFHDPADAERFAELAKSKVRDYQQKPK